MGIFYTGRLFRPRMIFARLAKHFARSAQELVNLKYPERQSCLWIVIKQCHLNSCTFLAHWKQLPGYGGLEIARLPFNTIHVVKVYLHNRGHSAKVAPFPFHNLKQIQFSTI